MSWKQVFMGVMVVFVASATVLLVRAQQEAARHDKMLKSQMTAWRLERASEAIRGFRARYGCLPGLSEMIQKRMLRLEDKTDSWGKELQLRLAQGSLSIISAGADGQIDTHDDVAFRIDGFENVGWCVEDDALVKHSPSEMLD